MNVVNYNGVAFNAGALAGLSEQEFKDQNAHFGFNEEQLKEAYALIKKYPADAKPLPAYKPTTPEVKK